MKAVLAYGMTVQSDFGPPDKRLFHVYCIQCKWQSEPTPDFAEAGALARRFRSHPCPFKLQFHDNRKARGWK